MQPGYYVGAFGGANWLSFSNEKKHYLKGTKFDTGYHAGGSLGYRYSNGVRIEGEIAYRNNKLNHPEFPKKGSHTTSITYMGNALYDFNLYPFKPYVGVGLGYIQGQTHIKSNDGLVKGKGSGIAGQAIAGVSYEICDKTEVGIEYRYLYARKNMNEQSLGLTVKRFF